MENITFSWKHFCNNRNYISREYIKGLRNIDTDLVVTKAFTDPNVLASFQQALLTVAVIKIDIGIAKDMLYMIILFVRVRSFSKARKLLEKYKKTEKTSSKSKALRKSLKNKTSGGSSKNV